MAASTALEETAGGLPPESGLRSLPPSAPRPYRVARAVGRLCEIRVFGVFRPEDISALSVDVRDTVMATAMPGVIVGDYREAPPFTPSIADQWSREMRSFNTWVDRSGLLLSQENETFNLQFERVIRCAGLTTRRCFYDARELQEWMREVLTDAERSRLHELLFPPSSAEEAPVSQGTTR